MRTQIGSSDCYLDQLWVAGKMIPVLFRDGPMLKVNIGKSGHFYRQIEHLWNQSNNHRQDPHAALLELPSCDFGIDIEIQREFIAKFLQSSSTAIRVLDNGQEAACASLEHHANCLMSLRL